VAKTDTAVREPTAEGAEDQDDEERNGESNGQVETEISVKGLTKSFGSQTVLEDITCDIPKGKITLMLGPSGTGKSVFLKNVMGILKPEKGEIWIGGKNIVKLRSRDLYKVRRRMGVLFQDGALFGSMSVYDNVAFPLREHTKKREGEIKKIVNEKLEMVGLMGAEKKLPGEISGGMKKRAGLARALVLDPEIVMFDEPDSGLDPVRTAFLNELILDLNRQLQATFIVVTHDIATAKRVADYIGMLYRRNLVRFGPAKEMFESDIPVVRQFLAGDTVGPIGMSEEADQTKPQSSSGMTAEETEQMERDAGAPSEDEGKAEGKAEEDGDGEGGGRRWHRLDSSAPPRPDADGEQAGQAAAHQAPPRPDADEASAGDGEAEGEAKDQGGDAEGGDAKGEAESEAKDEASGEAKGERGDAKGEAKGEDEASAGGSDGDDGAGKDESGSGRDSDPDRPSQEAKEEGDRREREAEEAMERTREKIESGERSDEAKEALEQGDTDVSEGEGEGAEESGKAKAKGDSSEEAEDPAGDEAQGENEGGESAEPQDKDEDKDQEEDGSEREKES
jgi:phospholipid/cholesterol/gamma-HCH transport system ATP-binding protein